MNELYNIILNQANKIKQTQLKPDTQLTKDKDVNHLIVGIDGLGGSGKSTISSKLCHMLKDNGYNAIVFHIDDFIHPKCIRYNGDYPEWQCYYDLQWRYDYFIEEIIEPLRKQGQLQKFIELYDKENDCYREQEIKIDENTIVIVEGIFLQRKELVGVFDYMIYLDVAEEVRLQRVLKRDTYIGEQKQIIEKYASRYFPAEHHYMEENKPIDRADYVI